MQIHSQDKPQAVMNALENNIAGKGVREHYFRVELLYCSCTEETIEEQPCGCLGSHVLEEKL